MRRFETENERGRVHGGEKKEQSAKQCIAGRREEKKILGEWKGQFKTFQKYRATHPFPTYTLKLGDS